MDAYRTKQASYNKLTIEHKQKKNATTIIQIYLRIKNAHLHRLYRDTDVHFFEYGESNLFFDYCCTREFL